MNVGACMDGQHQLSSNGLRSGQHLMSAWELCLHFKFLGHLYRTSLGSPDHIVLPFEEKKNMNVYFFKLWS